LFFS
jgi:hypothetical protein